MTEITKPPELARALENAGLRMAIQLHLGVEIDFRPARKAHPALRRRDCPLLLTHLRRHGVEVTEVDDIPGVQRCHIFDPFGNRIELVAA